MIYDTDQPDALEGGAGHDPETPHPPHIPVISEERRKVQELVSEAGGNWTLAVALACLRGYDYKFEGVYGHGFHSKPTYTSPTGPDAKIINGQLSHMLNLRPDDQLYYQITKVGGIVQAVRIRIDPGGWGVIFGPVASVIGGFLGIPVPAGLITQITQSLEQAAQGGDWVTAADAIVAQVAIRA